MFKSSFQDHFSQAAAHYAAARPFYPQELFTYLSKLCSQHEVACDCATGNGQAALGLAQHFSLVEATDPSVQQISNAILHPKVRYSVGRAESSKFADSRFDLISVAQALHWFEIDKFYLEAKRILKQGGVLAVWGYTWFRVDEQIDGIVQRELLEPIKSFWAPQNQILWDGYQSITFPFTNIAAPSFAIELNWELQDLIDYVKTWSAVRAYENTRGQSIADSLYKSLLLDWGNPQDQRNVCMDLVLRVGRNEQ